MNKLFATIVLAAFALSGCIKEDDSYKELLPLQPGMNIYNMTMTQNAVAMQPANAGIRGWPCCWPRPRSSIPIPNSRTWT